MRLGKYLSSLTKPELEELRDLLNLSDDEYPILKNYLTVEAKYIFPINVKYVFLPWIIG